MASKHSDSSRESPDLIRLLVDVVDPPPTLKDVEMIQQGIKNHESDNA